MPIMFNSLLVSANLDPFNVKLARHSPSNRKISPFALWRRSPTEFEAFQCIQSNRVFKPKSYIASFIETPSSKNLFVGIYFVENIIHAPPNTIDPADGLDACGKHLYGIVKTDYLSEYKGRLYVGWSNRSFTLHASRNSIEVSELLSSYEEEPFPGYFKFKCNLSELKSLPCSWKTRLKEAKGVYLLTSLQANNHYVGSAAGAGGFLHRWMQHANTGGAAIGLQAHGAPDYQVTILQVAAGFETKDDIVRVENEWMRKLLSRTMGLNRQPQNAILPNDAQ